MVTKTPTKTMSSDITEDSTFTRNISVSLFTEKRNGLSLLIHKSLHEEFEQFCKDIEMSETEATKNAIRMYIAKMKKNR